MVDYQIQERERIRQDELDFLRGRVMALQLEDQTEKLRMEARAAVCLPPRDSPQEQIWHRQQQMLLDAEKSRRTSCDDCVS